MLQKICSVYTVLFIVILWFLLARERAPVDLPSFIVLAVCSLIGSAISTAFIVVFVGPITYLLRRPKVQLPRH